MPAATWPGERARKVGGLPIRVATRGAACWAMRETSRSLASPSHDADVHLVLFHLVLEGQALARLEGSATVNGRPAKVGTAVKPGDRIATGKGSQAVVVMGSDAFLLRGDTTVETKGSGGVATALTVLNGKLLSVFGKKPMSIQAGPAAIGIRGTGAYLEVEAARVYFCLCYGEAVIDGKNMPSKVVKTDHHESPLWLARYSSSPGTLKKTSSTRLITLSHVPPTYPATRLERSLSTSWPLETTPRAR